MYACIRRTASVYDNGKQFAETSKEKKGGGSPRRGGEKKDRRLVTTQVEGRSYLNCNDQLSPSRKIKGQKKYAPVHRINKKYLYHLHPGLREDG